MVIVDDEKGHGLWLKPPEQLHRLPEQLIIVWDAHGSHTLGNLPVKRAHRRAEFVLEIAAAVLVHVHPENPRVLLIQEFSDRRRFPVAHRRLDDRTRKIGEIPKAAPELLREIQCVCLDGFRFRHAFAPSNGKFG